MSFLTRQVTTENDALAGFAANQIRQIACALQGLSDEQIRMKPTASVMSLAGLARHCLYVGNEGIFTAFDASRATATRDSGNHAAGQPSDEAVLDGDTADSLIAELEDMAAWVETTLAQADMDQRVPIPDAPWFPQDLGTWPGRWVAIHAVEEYARHAGHADILREAIDGKGAYELNALADGEPWPPEGWD
ncbi:DUF664 domain-containing protein [Kocuria coralli]|uniref:DUF664 domain-containing protein n=1 Tax=Kocuria coralli TaxID=1461025 RepID=A0A5J5KWC3_9MICC|nr:DUF664 domain-containing protein [Kocuria coralli]KAA9393914.1 DUF664 domain-containing protein [Kocuria coralli]